MTIHDFIEQHELPDRDAPMNVIDLDTGHRVTPLLQLPECIEQISLVDRQIDRGPFVIPPERDPRRGISNYLLLSEKNCLTDFHQDFTGTSVFYLVVKGEKTFLLVRPTPNNQHVYGEWSELDERKGCLFFGDMPLDNGGCVKVKLVFEIKI